MARRGLIPSISHCSDSVASVATPSAANDKYFTGKRKVRSGGTRVCSAGYSGVCGPSEAIAQARTTMVQKRVRGRPEAIAPCHTTAFANVTLARQTNANASLVLRGSLTEKCPVAGCWFVLQDAGGTIKVDTKNAGFVVVDVPLRSTVTVAGRVVTNGSERFIDATGLRY